MPLEFSQFPVPGWRSAVIDAPPGRVTAVLRTLGSAAPTHTVALPQEAKIYNH